jgi:hypothetical protein
VTTMKSSSATSLKLASLPKPLFGNM